ncbi:MAG: tyrosine-type recombinase/integrase [Nostoc sp. JL33]|uniref:site-specific integrase n=2 Tax=Nostoc TaxID=1177 RepID=UPI0026011EAE|nr:site-specific integrase [Nostoc sp. JL33]MBN3869333.1 tyrosine-type recombinase/integrase [Nostoc sp. JL33]
MVQPIRTRQARGTVGIEDHRGKLRLRLPTMLTKQGQSRYMMTGLDASDYNRKQMRMLVALMDEEIATGLFDCTLERYKNRLEGYNRPQLTIVKPHQPQQDLAQLWAAYCAYMEPQLAATTYRRDYARKYTNHIAALPTKDLNEAIAIRDHLLATLSPNAAKRVITYLAACCKWAVGSGMVKDNPFAGMSEDIKLPKHDADAIDPFSREEMHSIIKAFEVTRPHYAPFVKFLFWTGCRTGEAIGLTWGHINQECTQITFCESYDSGLKVRKGTKTGKARKFPCNSQLRELLLSIKPADAAKDTSVFTSPNGGMVNNTKFSTQVWKGGRAGDKTYRGVIQGLMDSGAINRYRCLYNTRHTFITLMLAQRYPVSTVARLVGNSPAIILKHYAGNGIPIELPEM